MDQAMEVRMSGELLRMFWTALTGSVAMLGGDLTHAVVETVRALLQ